MRLGFNLSKHICQKKIIRRDCVNITAVYSLFVLPEVAQKLQLFLLKCVKDHHVPDGLSEWHTVTLSCIGLKLYDVYNESNWIYMCSCTSPTNRMIVGFVHHYIPWKSVWLNYYVWGLGWQIKIPPVFWNIIFCLWASRTEKGNSRIGGTSN